MHVNGKRLLISISKQTHKTVSSVTMNSNSTDVISVNVIQSDCTYDMNFMLPNKHAISWARVIFTIQTKFLFENVLRFMHVYVTFVNKTLWQMTTSTECVSSTQ